MSQGFEVSGGIQWHMVAVSGAIYLLNVYKT